MNITFDRLDVHLKALKLTRDHVVAAITQANISVTLCPRENGNMLLLRDAVKYLNSVRADLEAQISAEFPGA